MSWLSSSLSFVPCITLYVTNEPWFNLRTKTNSRLNYWTAYFHLWDHLKLCVRTNKFMSSSLNDLVSSSLNHWSPASSADLRVKIFTSILPERQKLKRDKTKPNDQHRCCDLVICDTCSGWNKHGLATNMQMRSDTPSTAFHSRNANTL